MNNIYFIILSIIVIIYVFTIVKKKQFSTEIKGEWHNIHSPFIYSYEGMCFAHSY